MSDKANINPKILRWARESARFTTEDAAQKISVAPDKLLSWEQGDDLPTIRQAEQLAKIYRRPFALFFLPDIPFDFQPLTDYRRSNAKPLGTASTFIIREIQQKQAWISELYEENQEEVLGFVGRFSINDSPDKVAKDMLSELNIDPSEYHRSPIIKEWIEKAESKGVFISRTSFIHTRLKLDSDELQGFAIADERAPFVFINSDDWEAPQLFTLVHELAHIWIAASGISGDVESHLLERDTLHPVKLFCNEVAAAALMPEGLMTRLPINTFAGQASVFATAKSLGVSSFALLYRAYGLSLISLDRYRYLKSLADQAFAAYVEKEQAKKLVQAKSGGGPNPYLLRVYKNSVLFTKVVLDAFRGGQVAPTQASTLLNTPTNKFPKLEAFLYS